MTAVLSQSRPTGGRAPVRTIRSSGRHLELYRPAGAAELRPVDAHARTRTGPAHPASGLRTARAGSGLPTARSDSSVRTVLRTARPTSGLRTDARRIAAQRTAAQRTAARRLDPAVYRRRRLLAGGLLLLAIAAVLVLAQLIWAGIGGGPLTTTGAAAGPGMIQAGTTDYVVRPGDTLWSIAAHLAPGRDERPLVDQLAKETHGASLYPGEVIALPGR